MSEEYDVFGELEALCSDKLDSFKTSELSTELTLEDNKSNDDDIVWKDDISDASKSIDTSSTKPDSTLEYLNNVLELGSSKTKQKKGGKKSNNSDKAALSSLEYGLTTTLAERSTPEQNLSTLKRSSPAKRDLSPLTIGETPSTVRRLTRSTNRVDSSIEEQRTDATHGPPVVQPEVSIATEIAPPQTGRGRRSTRGRKKQTQSTVENQVPAQTAWQSLVLPQAEVPRRARSRRNPIQNMYSCREFAALMAAHSSNVSYVDLVSSPVPRIDGVINVDSDTEEQTETTTGSSNAASGSVEKNNSLDLSFDEENPEISVKIIWNGNPETFNLRRYQKFANIFSTIAQREGTDEKNLVFNINNKILSANDTPASIDYKIYQFINGRVLVSKFNSPAMNEKKKRDPNKISLKIQTEQWKRPMPVELLKTDKLKILYIKCAEELNIPYENLKLSFDGELLEFDGTPADFDLEGGEAIDLRIKK